MKKTILFLLILVLAITAGCKKAVKSQPKIPMSVKNIADENSANSSQRGKGSAVEASAKTFIDELNTLTDQYNCVMRLNTTAAVTSQSKGTPVVTNSKTTRKIKTTTVANTNADTTENTNSNTSANTNSNTSSTTVENSITSKSSGSKTRNRKAAPATKETTSGTTTANTNADTNSTTNSNISANTASKTDAEATEEVTETTESTETVITYQCGNLTVDTQTRDAYAMTLRDTIISRIMRVIDYNYYQFENDLYVRRSTSSFLADVLDTGTNLAATITNGERAKTVINASLNAFRVGRKSATLNFYRDQTLEVLIIKMQTARDRKKADIIRRKRGGVGNYQLDDALGDVVEYFFAGTLPRALQQLKVDAGNAAQDAEDEKGRAVEGLPSKLATESNLKTSLDAREVLSSLEKSLADNAKESATSKTLLKIVKKLQENAGIKVFLSKVKPPLTENDLNEDKPVGKNLLAAIRAVREDISFSNDSNKNTLLELVNQTIIDSQK